jgi:predicted transcriptional regulator
MTDTTFEAFAMGDSTTLTIRIDKSMKERLEREAQRQRRSKAFVAIEAIEEYLSVQEWQEQRIREALAAADRGEGVEHTSVQEWVEAWGSGRELPTPKV